ncbi:hypothetical protein D3C76_1208590 [compost metagenome]
MQQVAVGGVQLDEVEPGFTGIGRRLAEVGDDTGDFRLAQRPRRRGFHTHQVALLVTQGGAGSSRQRRRCHRGFAAGLQGSVRYPPGVPHLHGAMAAIGVDAFVDTLPGGDLLGAVDARRAGIAFGLEGNLRGFGDDQPGAGALAVVLGHQRGRYVTRLEAAQAGEGGHEHAVGQGERADFQGLQEFHCCSRGGKPMVRTIPR